MLTIKNNIMGMNIINTLLVNLVNIISKNNNRHNWFFIDCIFTLSNRNIFL